MKNSKSNNRYQEGFTLIELMIVVAIVAIISAIALPSYQEHVKNTRRAAAATCLLEMSQQMERRFTTSMQYNGTTTLPSVACTTPITDYYSFSFASAEPTDGTYKILATPLGGQTDSVCQVLAIDQKTKKYYNSSDSAADTVKKCWK